MLPLPNIEIGTGRACKICQNKAGNKIHFVREMMLGLLDLFQYMECNGCGCLQLLDPPLDLAPYYPREYTGFLSNGGSKAPIFESIRRRVRKQRNKGFLPGQGWLSRRLARQYNLSPLKAFGELGLPKRARILDVGCGSGALLMDLKELGYENLLGVDRFIPAPIGNGNGLRVVKGTLEDLPGTTWDLVMFHHSFEHMRDPVAVLRQTAALLAPGGRCLVRIPVVAWAWQHYGVNWVQIDAPRHFFLHTERSFRLIAGAAGLKVVNLSYDSDECQFWASELYARNVPLFSLEKLSPDTVFSRSQLRRFRLQAAELNAAGRGDSAVFVLAKP